MELYVGADWDSKCCVVDVRDAGGAQCVRSRVARDAASVAAFVDELLDSGATGVRVGVESGDPLWVRMWCATRATVHVINSRQAKAFIDFMSSSLSRSDVGSAEALAAIVAMPSHRGDPVNVETTDEADGTRVLLKTLDMTTTNQARALNQMRSHLRTYWPALERHLPKAEMMTTTWFARVLEAVPSQRAWAALDPAAQEEVLGFAREARRHALRKALDQDDAALGTELDAAVQARTRCLLRSLRTAIENKKAAQQAANAAAARSEIGKVVRTFNGIGPFLGLAVLVTLIVAPGRDLGASHLCTTPETAASGHLGRLHPLVMMRRSASSVMRKGGLQLGLAAREHTEWGRAQYAWLRAQGKTHGTAARIVGRSYYRIIHAVVRDNATYDEQRYIDKQKARGVPWAQPL